MFFVHKKLYIIVDSSQQVLQCLSFALQIILCHKQGTWSPSLRNSTLSKVRVSGAATSLIVNSFCFGSYVSVRKHLDCSLCFLFYQSSSSFFLALKSQQIPFVLYSGVFNTFRLCAVDPNRCTSRKEVKLRSIMVFQAAYIALCILAQLFLGQGQQRR